MIYQQYSIRVRSVPYAKIAKSSRVDLEALSVKYVKITINRSGILCTMYIPLFSKKISIEFCNFMHYSV